MQHWKDGFEESTLNSTTSKTIISLTDIDIPLNALLKLLRTDEESEAMEDITAMHREAAGIANPAAVYAPFSPEVRSGILYINETGIEDPFVIKMLSGHETVVPYAATCGTELDAWAGGFTDIYEQFIADSLKALYLSAVQEKLFSEVKNNFFNRKKHISSLNPGSLSEWPITGQSQLFRILGEVSGDIGIVLTESFLMIPNKSVSGIFFGSEEEFHNCQLCPRDDCPNRRAPYSGCE